MKGRLRLLARATLFLVAISECAFAAESLATGQCAVPPLCGSLEPARKRRRPNYYSSQAGHFIGSVVEDAIRLNANLFSWDSFKIVATFFPFYVSTRIIDEKLQNCFYEPAYHKNKNQLPGWCHEVAEWSIALPIIFLGQNAFFSRDQELQLTSRIFLIGMPFVIWTKDLSKKFEFDACWRPWNEHFSRKKRSKGGFPSGHMAQATFAAVLYGMRFGYKYALPLGALAGFVGVTFLSCNRHYLSQLVAGAGFGTLYAVAANKLIDSKLPPDLRLDCKLSSRGPTACLSYKF